MEKKQIQEEQVQESIKRIDDALAELNINRRGQIILIQDLRQVQKCCTEYFNPPGPQLTGKKDDGTDIIPISPATGDKNIEGSGDGI